jgi:hypothetical protein
MHIRRALKWSIPSQLVQVNRQGKILFGKVDMLQRQSALRPLICIAAALQLYADRRTQHADLFDANRNCPMVPFVRHAAYQPENARSF